MKARRNIENILFLDIETVPEHPHFDDLDQETKNQIDDLVNEIILEQIEAKTTKGGQIMARILQNNEKLWKEFRKLNSQTFFEENKFQEL